MLDSDIARWSHGRIRHQQFSLFCSPATFQHDATARGLHHLCRSLRLLHGLGAVRCYPTAVAARLFCEDAIRMASAPCPVLIAARSVETVWSEKATAPYNEPSSTQYALARQGESLDVVESWDACSTNCSPVYLQERCLQRVSTVPMPATLVRVSHSQAPLCRSDQVEDYSKGLSARDELRSCLHQSPRNEHAPKPPAKNKHDRAALLPQYDPDRGRTLGATAPQ